MNFGSALAVAPLHPKEQERLASVSQIDLDNLDQDAILALVARKAAEECGVPMALVTLIDEESQWYIGRSGIEGCRTDRSDAFCAHTILEVEPLVVEDAAKDARFANNPSVTGPPFIRFYAGAPMMDGGGLPLGSVCVIDTEPRDISMRSLLLLQRLAAVAAMVLEIRRLLSMGLHSGTSMRNLTGATAALEAALRPSRYGS